NGDVRAFLVDFEEVAEAAGLETDRGKLVALKTLLGGRAKATVDAARRGPRKMGWATAKKVLAAEFDTPADLQEAMRRFKTAKMASRSNPTVFLAGFWKLLDRALPGLDGVPRHQLLSDQFNEVYYLFAHAYNPPACKTAPPRSVRVSPVRFHQANAVNNGGPDGLWPLQTPILIGHAGAGMKHVHHESDRLWPDNTICAFRRAEQLGLPMVECDATVTKDYKAVLLHHNFTVRFHTDPFSVKDCNRSFNLAHLPDPPVDEQTTNLVVRYSFSELRGLLGRDPSARPIEDSSSGCITHPKALTSTDPLPDVQGVHGHPLPELADAFRQTSTQLGFNVELKYPRETLLGKITRAIHEDVPITPNLAGPHSYFAKINKFCDKILDTIWKNAGDRVVILSSFNADVCAVLRLKQSHLPVMFITRGGVPSPTEPPDMFHVDLRHTSLAVATSWAQIMGLDGVVTLGSHFGSDPKEHPITEDEISQNASDLTEKCLACFVYGSGVSEDEFFAKATKYGLTGVIIDRVDGYVQEHCDGISL
ncbi:hypothetical protein T265_14041, partial [Opisthorchis viverrini]